MGEIKDALDSIVHGQAARVGNAHELKSLFLIQIINEKNLILEDDPKGVQTHLDRLNDRNTQILAKREESLKISIEAGKKDLTTFAQLYKEWWESNHHIQALIKEDKQGEAFTLSKTRGRELRLKIEELLDGIVVRNENFMITDTKEAEADYNVAKNLVLTISIGSIVAGLLLAFFVLRAVGQSIGNVINVLTEGSSQVTSASQQIAASSEELSQAATEQASSLEETASSIEEMNSMVQKNAENARRTSQLASDSHKSAEKGKEVVRDMMKAIDEISTSNNTIKLQIDESNQQISDIVKVISEIGNKTKVINDIVFQTKLLSFNASVEAARAGEHGKGFAVVAEEVGNLAQMSGNAAKEISEMLEGSIKKVEGIVYDTKQKVTALMQAGNHKVESGTRIAQDCGSVLNEIVENVNSVTQMAHEISTACHEQALGVQEITKAMSQLDQVTQTNAATSEEVASSAEELSAQSESLLSAVHVLVKVINGDNGKEEFLDIAPVTQKAKRSNNVIPMKKTVGKLAQKPVKLKQASGAEIRGVPSEDDPRFQDI
jgi:methyl-accepting chemotaxis protein